MKRTPKHMDVRETRRLERERVSARNDAIKTIAAVISALAPLALKLVELLF